VKGLAIIRVEQMYPFPKTQLSAIIARYKNAERYVWLQEEPGNMGAWTFMMRNFDEVALEVVARPDSASPATGSIKIHQIEQLELFEQTLERSFHKEKEIRGLLTHFAK
ncbi:MAG TPA: hypothetical protein EYN51_08775, partial [Flavobacteriales bacterium]|nr:hypothetical protein [Flavobacteriales bacterium]